MKGTKAIQRDEAALTRVGLLDSGRWHYHYQSETLLFQNEGTPLTRH